MWINNDDASDCIYMQSLVPVMLAGSDLLNIRLTHTFKCCLETATQRFIPSFGGFYATTQMLDK